jgi:hypothetical protein
MKLHQSKKIQKIFESATSLKKFPSDWFAIKNQLIYSSLAYYDDQQQIAFWVGLRPRDKNSSSGGSINDHELFFQTVMFNPSPSFNSPQDFAFNSNEEMTWRILWLAGIDYYFQFKVFPSLRELESFLRDADNRPVIKTLEDFKVLVKVYQQWEEHWQEAFTAMMQSPRSLCPFKRTIEHHWNAHSHAEGATPSGHSVKKWALWSTVVNRVLQQDGGQVEVIDWTPLQATIVLKGHCQQCPRQEDLHSLGKWPLTLSPSPSVDSQVNSMKDDFKVFWIS